MFDAKISGEKNNGTVTLKGDLTIKNIEQIKETLRSALSRFKKITVKIDTLEKIDFSCFQVFCAAHKSAEKQKKSITIFPAPGDAFVKSLEIAGLAVKNENNEYISRGFSLQLNGTGRQNPK